MVNAILLASTIILSGCSLTGWCSYDHAKGREVCGFEGFGDNFQ